MCAWYTRNMSARKIFFFAFVFRVYQAHIKTGTRLGIACTLAAYMYAMCYLSPPLLSCPYASCVDPHCVVIVIQHFLQGHYTSTDQLGIHHTHQQATVPWSAVQSGCWCVRSSETRPSYQQWSACSVFSALMGDKRWNSRLSCIISDNYAHTINQTGEVSLIRHKLHSQTYSKEHDDYRCHCLI